MRRSIQWDILGTCSLVMTFVSFFAFIGSSASLVRNNVLLFGLSNPLLIVVFLLFAFMSFAFGYLEGRKEENMLVQQEPISMQLAQNPQEDPLELLRVRLAKGEITQEEYQRTREVLEN